MTKINTTLIKLSIILSLIGMLLIPSQSVNAHPADMYFQTYTITFDDQYLQIEWSISPGPLLAPSIWYDADVNHDNIIDDDEKITWLQPHILELQAFINGQPLPAWEIRESSWPLSLSAFEIGDETIEVTLRTTFPDKEIDHQAIQIHCQFNESISVNWFYLTSNDPFSFYVPRQEGGLLEWKSISNESSDTGDVQDKRLYTYWDSGIPSLPASQSQNAGIASPQNQPPEDNRPVTRLTNMLREENVSFLFYITAILVAIMLGALHALTPGHGKAIVAAYLIGSRGTMKHAVFLGLIVTITHTGSVFLLGLITMLASRYIVPTDLFPYLEIISGLMIAGLGIGLLIQRWKTWKENILHPPTYAIYKPKDESGDSQTRNQPLIKDRIVINQPIVEQGPAHKHPQIPEPDKVTLRSIIALGVSGGIVPCPDAVSILLIAVLINRIILGLSLIVAFSLGLAIILISIGMVMVHSQRFFLKFDRANRFAPLLSMFSAFIVFSLGLYLTINSINTNYGFFGSAPTTSLWNTPQNENEQILYLVLDEKNTNQLYITDIQGNVSPHAITAEEYGIWDYAVSPDRKWLVYSVPREAGGNDIHLMSSDRQSNEIILECPEATCTNATWSPDGSQIVYERLGFTSQNTVVGVPSLWWLDLESRQARSVFQDGELPGYSPQWSPDGKWLSYATPGNNLVQFYNLKDGSSFSLPSQSGGIADWEPDGKAVLLTDIRPQNDGYVIHLFSYSFEDQSLLDLTSGANAQDSIASWSPDGEWLAVVRRTFQNDQPISGDNIWLVSPDGSKLKQLTRQDAAYHSPPVWSPNGKYLLFHRYLILEKGMQSGIWMIDIQTGKETQITESGTRPAWLEVDS